jgi:NAD(P)H-dependent FMN reductase
MNRKKILAISGSTRKASVNLQILRFIEQLYHADADFIIYNEIDSLPHFNPDIDREPFPDTVIHFRKLIENADGVLICTPEYVFSLPGSFKNAIEWCVSTTLFTGKPVALITASSSGRVAHESLNLVMRTVGARLNNKCSILISAPKTKVSVDGQVTDENTLSAIRELMQTFLQMLQENEVPLAD